MQSRVWQKKVEGIFGEKGPRQLREEWTRCGFDGRMFRCRGNPSAASVSSAQQCASDSQDPTDRNVLLFFLILVFMYTTSSVFCSISHPSIVSTRLSSLISVCSLHFPWQVLDLRLQLRLLILKLRGIKMRFPITKDWSQRDIWPSMKVTFNAMAYQFFAGSRLHVVGIRISVLQCVTTLWREQTDSVSMWKHRPLCVTLWG